MGTGCTYGDAQSRVFRIDQVVLVSNREYAGQLNAISTTEVSQSGPKNIWFTWTLVDDEDIAMNEGTYLGRPVCDSR